MRITVGKTEYGLPQVEWEQSELYSSSSDAANIMLMTTISCIGLGFLIVLPFAVSFMKGDNNGGAFFFVILIIIGGGIGLGVTFGDIIAKAKITPTQIPGSCLSTRQFTNKMMLGFWEEDNAVSKAPVLLHVSGRDRSEALPQGHYDRLYADQVISFSVDTAVNWLNYHRELPPVHVMLANQIGGHAAVVAIHHGMLVEMTQLRSALQNTFVDSRPAGGWLAPSKPAAPPSESPSPSKSPLPSIGYDPNDVI